MTTNLSYKLILKYRAYHDAYDNQDYYIDKSKFNPKGTPELLDAYFTGCRPNT